jgi:hypothetical protein
MSDTAAVEIGSLVKRNTLYNTRLEVYSSYTLQGRKNVHVFITVCGCRVLSLYIMNVFLPKLEFPLASAQA